MTTDQGRKVVNISLNDQGQAIAVCSDGTCWYLRILMDGTALEWERLPSVPAASQAYPAKRNRLYEGLKGAASMRRS